MPRWLENTLLVTGSLLLCVIGGELAVRWLAPESTRPDNAPLQSVIEADPVLETRYKPNAYTRVRSQFGEFEIDYRFNALGLRDRPLPDCRGKRKILVLGNSFVEGWGVSLDESFLRVAERQLSAKHPTCMMNAGVSGYGAAQSYLLAKRFMPLIKPDALVFVYLSTMVQADHRFLKHARTDTRGMAEGVDVQAMLSDQSHAQQNSQLEGVVAWFKSAGKFSALAALIAQRLETFQAQQAIQPGDPQTDLLAGVRVSDCFMRGLHQPSLRHLVALGRLARENHTPLRVVLMPLPHQVSASEWSQGRQAYQLTAQRYPTPDLRVVGNFLKQQGIATLPADTVLRQHARHRPADPPIYYTSDFHLNARGHRILGEWFAQQFNDSFTP